MEDFYMEEIEMMKQSMSEQKSVIKRLESQISDLEHQLNEKN